MSEYSSSEAFFFAKSECRYEMHASARTELESVRLMDCFQMWHREVPRHHEVTVKVIISQSSDVCSEYAAGAFLFFTIKLPDNSSFAAVAYDKNITKGTKLKELQNRYLSGGGVSSPTWRNLLLYPRTVRSCGRAKT
jgi:hypothetical protein